MADSLSQFLANIPAYQYQPAMIQKDALDYLNVLLAGEVDVVDASNPFVFSMEMASVMTSAAMAKDQTRTRLQYPSVAQTPTDLWPHMSDWDYIDIFATPSSTTFGFAFSKDEIISKMVLDPTTGISMVVIPRNSTVTVAGITFTLQYPIQIRQLQHGGLQVMYDATETTPLQTLATNVIAPEIRRMSGIDMLYFEVPIYQISITSQTAPVTAASTFKMTYQMTYQYYYTRVWSQNSDGTWTELVTTMTPEVYDVTQPTAVITVTGQLVTVIIPNIYMTSGQLNSKIRCDFYETQGDISVDMGAYPTASFSAVWTAADPNDLTEFTAPMDTLQIVQIMGDSVTLGGAAALDFATLRDRVINNATGPINLPITPAQIQAKLVSNGYTVVKNVDNITNRTYLASRQMPTPTNPELITAAASSIETITTTMTTLAALPTVIDNGASVTITPDTIYKNVNGVVQIAAASEIAGIKALVPAQRALAVNAADYYYTPWHYVLDTTGVEFAVRPYYLNSPNAITTVYIDDNDTTGLQVSTGKYSLTRTTDQNGNFTNQGYTLTVVTNSSAAYQALPDSQVAVQLAYIPVGEQDYAYLNGVLQGLDPTSGERVFTFDLSTTFNIDSNNNIELTKFFMFTTDPRIVKAGLTTQFDLLYSTSATMDPTVYKPKPFEQKLGRFLIPANSVGIQNEQIRLQFGNALTTLWARARSVIGAIPYQTYATDVPRLYTEDIYATDSNGSYITFDAQGNPVITVLHHKGDPQLDANGNPIMDHYAGDVVTDASGAPVPGGQRDLERQLDLMLIEGAYYFATDSAATGYRQELVNTVLAWLLNDLLPLQQILLEQTQIFFYPQATMGDITVINQAGLKVGITAAQQIQLTLYVTPQTAQDTDLTEQLTTAAINTLQTQLQNATFASSDAITALKTIFGSDVIDTEMLFTGGAVNMPVFTVVDDSTRCGLKKILVAQGDNSLIVSEAVTVIFTPYDTSASNAS
jgi:hypothetical protein